MKKLNKLKAIKIFLSTSVLLAALTTKAQVGIGTATPAASAQLDISSTTKGFLPPRMDSAQRNAIISPSVGLTIYNTSAKAFECYNGTAWYSTVHYIGEDYGGGIVFYIYDNGQHGLIAAKQDQSSSAEWGLHEAFTNAVRDGINAGMPNTERIIINQGGGLTDQPNSLATYAAALCANYQGGGFGDWYLPSISELTLLLDAGKNGFVGVFSKNYWSSTEFSYFLAPFWAFADRGGLAPKNASLAVRAIRAF